MKKYLTVLLRIYVLMIGFFFCLITIVQGAQIIVQLNNPPQGGSMVFLLFDSADTFGDFSNYTKKLRFTSDGRKIYRVPDIPPGGYALLVYYDENGNGSLDKNFIGIPIEPVGFSNRYRPKGPPNYNQASFQLKESEIRTFDIELSRPLGKFGRLGVGIGVIGQSSPYRDYGKNIFQVIPAFTYISKRFQLFGPNLKIGLAGIGDLTLAATARYRMGAYEEKDSSILTGLGDRKDTLMAGLAVGYDFSDGFELSGEYEHDLLNRIGGGTAKLMMEKSFQLEIVRLSPKVTLKWLGAELSNYDFGVPEGGTRKNRPAYSLNETFGIEVGISSFLELSRNWRATINIDVERLDKEIINSPIVNEKLITKGFTTLNYVF